MNQTELEKIWPHSFVINDSHLASYQVQIMNIATPGVWQLDVIGDREYNITVSAQTEFQTHATLIKQNGEYSPFSGGWLTEGLPLNKLFYTEPALVDFEHFALGCVI